jgi:hypothetical protein
MTVEVSPQSRVQVLDCAPVAPGVCILCGIADGRKFVDFGKQVEWYGAVYFCSECIGEVARALGWVPVAEYNELLAEFKKLDAGTNILVREKEQIHNALATVFRTIGSGNMPVDEFVRAVEADDKKPAESRADDIDADKRESKTDESVVVEGPDDIFDDSDFE